MSDFVNFNELVDSIVIEKDYGANRPVKMFVKAV